MADARGRDCPLTRNRLSFRMHLATCRFTDALLLVVGCSNYFAHELYYNFTGGGP